MSHVLLPFRNGSLVGVAGSSLAGANATFMLNAIRAPRAHSVLLPPTPMDTKKTMP